MNTKTTIRTELRERRVVLAGFKLWLAAATLLGAINLFADTAIANGLTWTYTVSNGKATVGSGSSSSTAIPNRTTGPITIPSELGGYPVTSITSFAFYNCSGLTSVTIPDGVTSIGSSAFSGCSGLTSVTIPDGVTSIGLNAFSGCSGLTSVTIPDSVTSIGNGAFSNCNNSLFDTTSIPGVRIVDGWAVDATGSLSGHLDLSGVRGIAAEAFNNYSGKFSGLTSVTIPDGVTSIGDGAFSGCSGLTGVTIPDGVTSIGLNAFYGCSGLTSVTIPDSVTSIENGAFYKCDNLYDTTSIFGVKLVDGWAIGTTGSLYGHLDLTGVRGIGVFAFYGCSDLTSVTIGDNVNSIGRSAFSGCSGLVSVTIPDSVSIIYASAFYNCRSLKSVKLPATMTTISSSLLSDCTNLTSVAMGKYVTSIGANAFNNCKSLTRIVLPSSVRNITETAFSGCNIGKFTLPYELGENGFGNGNDDAAFCRYSVDETSGVRRLTVHSQVFDSAFEGFEDAGDYFDELVIDSGITAIGQKAFRNCARVRRIAMPESVRTIGANAFEGCSGIETVTIPEGVTYIDESAFEGCSGLETVTIPDSVTAIGNAAFRNCSSLKTVYMSESLMNTLDESVFEGCDRDFTEYYRYSEEPEKTPNPPMSVDYNISITPTTRNFGKNGGGNAILVSGSSATWTAAVSDPWITLNSSSGNVGYPVAYTVSATTNVESRTGYVYVSGNVHTVTQDGVGATLDHNSATYETAGGREFVNVTAPDKTTWKVRTNVDWILHDTATGMGEGSVEYVVLPYDEVATRQGSLTIAGNTFTVFQYGRRMKLNDYCVTNNYETHVIPITVNAMATTQWSVSPNNSWISVVDGGNGRGSDQVTIAIAENPSYKARTGTVAVGTETFTVVQLGRPTEALSFSVSPTASTASVAGANGLVTVMATPDLPWTATSGANWCTVYAATANGAGNGNVVYVASPNPTIYERVGTITVTPEPESGMAAKTHTVTQPAAQVALSLNGYEFEASGEACSVEVSVSSIVEWEISESLDWLSVNGSTSRTGPGTVVLQADANDSIYPRSGTVTIAGKAFSVLQKGYGVGLEYDTKLFGTDGGDESISIHPDGNVSWTAVASDPSWIIIFQGDSGTGDGEIMYIVAPYVGDGGSRMGWITVGDQKVYITQRAYELSISPNGTWVTGNNGEGEFGVSAGIGDVWTAIVTEPWITIVSGYDTGTGSGTVRFVYTENTTGKTRTGKIVVAGEVYTVEQRARTMVAIEATVEHGGSVSGGGSYDLGTEVTLTAVPDSGYRFSYWTGAVESMQNPLQITADVAKSYTAVFEPLPIAFTSVSSGVDGVALAWNNLAWATTFRIYRGLTSVPSSAIVLAELPNNGSCEYLDDTGNVGVEYWYWIEAESVMDSVMSDPMTGRKEKPVVYSSITYTNLRGATNPNPATYQEGTLVSFSNPGSVTGYTFAGWTPSQITTDMTGAQTVRASWTANSYSIAYNPNGGSGTMNPTACTYDSEANIAANGFAWAGHMFKGWATGPNGDVAYAAGQAVTNLTAQSSGVVTLYAVWEDLVVAVPTVVPGDGTVFTEDSCTVTLSCETEGAVIYYSPKGATPRLTETYRYTGPFTITDTATIKAIAVLEGVRSEYVTATITRRTLSLVDAACVDGQGDGLTFTTGGDADWKPIGDATAASGLSVQSGAIGDYEETWLQAVVNGVGTFEFQWKVDCEWDDSGDASWDHAAVFVDGDEMSRIDGTSDWRPMSFTFTGKGTHTIRWTFVKDDYDEEGTDYSDCAWVSGIVWTLSGATGDDEPLPEATSDESVEEILADAASDSLKENVTDVAEYSAFRAWADRCGATHAAVKASPNAWLSFALNSPILIEKELTDDDISVESFAPTGTAGAFSMEVGIEDVEIGSGAAASRLAKLFGLEGSAELSESQFSSDNVTLEIGENPVSNGNVKLTAKPNVSGGSFFMRVKLKK